jgi:hypothetical protein
VRKFTRSGPQTRFRNRKVPVTEEYVEIVHVETKDTLKKSGYNIREEDNNTRKEDNTIKTIENHTINNQDNVTGTVEQSEKQEQKATR